MPSTRRWHGVVHVRWELPFRLRLPSTAFLVWEPEEHACLVAFFPEVGAISWRRRTTVLDGQTLYGEEYVKEPAEAVPSRDYKFAAIIGEKRYYTTVLKGGSAGGFEEAWAYCTANVNLCLSRAEDFKDADRLLARAADAINNVIGVHSFVAADGLARALRPALDSYYTSISLARVPNDWPQMTADDLLIRINDLHFQSEIGHGRQHNVGLGAADDLTIGLFDDEALEVFMANARERFDLAPHQQLFLSAIRRLTRREAFLSVIDAESAFEVCLAELLRKMMVARGSSEEQVEQDFNGPLNGLQQRIVRFDRLAESHGASKRFENSEVHREWSRGLAKLRHRIVHRGLREVPQDDARKAVSVGMKAAAYLEDLVPQFAPRGHWGGQLLELSHVRDSPGKLFRLFEG